MLMNTSIPSLLMSASFPGGGSSSGGPPDPNQHQKGSDLSGVAGNLPERGNEFGANNHRIDMIDINGGNILPLHQQVSLTRSVRGVGDSGGDASEAAATTSVATVAAALMKRTAAEASGDDDDTDDTDSEDMNRKRQRGESLALLDTSQIAGGNGSAAPTGSKAWGANTLAMSDQMRNQGMGNSFQMMLPHQRLNESATSGSMPTSMDALVGVGGSTSNGNNSAGSYLLRMNHNNHTGGLSTSPFLRDNDMAARNPTAATNAMLLAQLHGQNSNNNNNQNHLAMAGNGGHHMNGNMNNTSNQFMTNNGMLGVNHTSHLDGNNSNRNMSPMRGGGSNMDMFGPASAQAQASGALQWGNQFQRQGGVQQLQQLTSLPSLDPLHQFRQQPHGGGGGGSGNGGANHHPNFAALPATDRDFSSLLRQFISSSNNMQPMMRESDVVGMAATNLGLSRSTGTTNFPVNGTLSSNPQVSFAQQQQIQPFVPAQRQMHQQQNEMRLPLCIEGQIASHYTRPFYPLGLDEDPNWLSEFHCYVRSDLVEVFRASHDDVRARNNSIAYQQVGLRCRFCAHITPSARAGRSSAFPSSVRQIYQSFTMMLRDHFANCDAMPAPVLQKFTTLKDKPAQGATDSKRYWVYSASKIGMIDTSDGLLVTEQSHNEGARLPPFGTVAQQKWEDDDYRDVPLVLPSDRTLIAEFLFVIMSQVQPIRLTEAECIGNRRSLRVGLPGFGCRHCCEHRRLGLCRMFPARRRTLPSKMNDLYDHLRRCTLCPSHIKDLIESTKHQMNSGFHADQGGDREFFDRVWTRLGHTS